MSEIDLQVDPASTVLTNTGKDSILLTSSHGPAVVLQPGATYTIKHEWTLS